MVIQRRLRLPSDRSVLLLGPRRVGKTTYLRDQLEGVDVWIDLLKTDEYLAYATRPALLRERYAAGRGLLVIDEVQRLPDLLFEVHWLIENSKRRFLLSGSSARALRRRGVTNLAGRLRTVRLFPLTWHELGGSYDLLQRLQHGCLPPVVFADDPADELRAYCGEYLREEIQAEGLVRSLATFTRFLEAAALANAQLVSYAPIASDCGVSAKTVQDYFQILEDTLLGFRLEPWTRTKKRRAILSPKFYFFDCGVPNVLLGRTLSRKTPEFGHAFEHAMVLETVAAAHYDRRFEKVRFWRSASGFEVDLLLDDHTAVEFKSGNVHDSDTVGLRALGEEMRLKRKWVVCTEPVARRLANGIEVLPWQEYLTRLRAL